MPTPHDNPAAQRAIYLPHGRGPHSGHTGWAWPDTARGDCWWIFERDLEPGETYDAVGAETGELEFGDQVDAAYEPVRSYRFEVGTTITMTAAELDAAITAWATANGRTGWVSSELTGEKLLF